jgi:opacity protein-like surface antigen
VKKYFLLLLFPIVAFANENSWYVVGSFGRSYTDWMPSVKSIIGDQINNTIVRNGTSGTSYGAKVGYKINKNFSVELDYFDLAGLKKDNIVTNSYSRQSHKFTAGLIKYLPNINYANLSPYLTAGISHRRVIESAYLSDHTLVDRGVSEKTQPAFGCGLDYKINDNWFVNVDFIMHRSFISKGVRILSSKLINIGLGFAI